MSAYAKYLKSLIVEDSSDSFDSDSDSDLDETMDNKRDKKRKSNGTETPKRLPKRPRLSSIQTARNNDNIDPLEGPSWRYMPNSAQTNNSEEKESENQSQMTGAGQRSYERGTIVFTDPNVEVEVKAVEHKRYTRFRSDDHLYQVKIHPKRRNAPLLLSLENALREALLAILIKLKNNYPSHLHQQVYITIIESNILHGLNTGNFDLNGPGNEIVNRAITILHSYLKSNQTMKLNNSFKIQIRVLGHNHTVHLQQNNPRFKKKIFRDYRKF